ncbi:hypothetical protein Tco_0523302 [Tanacetum coccineum]
MMGDLETKMEVETPYELLKDDQKKQLRKNNKAKMTLYNALPRKEYEQVFMCKTVKGVCHIFIITHQGNSQVKDCKIDLLTQKYEKLSISSEETIDTSSMHCQKYLNLLSRNYSCRIHKVSSCSSIEMESQENDGVVSKSTKEKVNSLALKAKVIREQTNDDNDSQGGSDEDVDEEEEAEFNLMARNFRKVLNKETIRIKKSLNVTFDESLPEPKSSLWVKDDMINEPIVQDLNELLLFLDEGYLKILKEARGHPIKQVTSELKERTLRKIDDLKKRGDPIWDKISCKLEEPFRDIHVDECVCCQVQHMMEENIYSLRKEMREIHAFINNDLKVLTAVFEDIGRVFLQDNNEELIEED